MTNKLELTMLSCSSNRTSSTNESRDHGKEASQSLGDNNYNNNELSTDIIIEE